MTQQRQANRSSDKFDAELCGPITGALIGLVYMITLAFVWRLLGRPDVFRDAHQGVILVGIQMIIGGVVVGTLLGAALKVFYRRSQRRVQIRKYLCGTLIAGCLIFVPLHWAEINAGHDPVFVTTFAVNVCFGLAFAAFVFAIPTAKTPNQGAEVSHADCTAS